MGDFCLPTRDGRFGPLVGLFDRLDVSFSVHHLVSLLDQPVMGLLMILILMCRVLQQFLRLSLTISTGAFGL
jgi:hypothetical protein